MKKTVGDFKYPEKTANGKEWIHIDLWFSKKFSDEQMSDVKTFLFYIYGRIYPWMSRCFYLCEGRFLMFAVEVRNRGYIETIDRTINDLKKIYIDNGEIKAISKITIERNTNDYENGDGFLNVMNAIAEYEMIHRDNSATHLIHCMVNSMLLPYGKESKFYKLLGKTY
jgi:hypothetical protein